MIKITSLKGSIKNNYIGVNYHEDRIVSIIVMKQKYNDKYSIYFSNVLLNGFDTRESFIELLDEFLTRMKFDFKDRLCKDLRILISNKSFQDKSMFGLKINFMVIRKTLVIMKIFYNQLFMNPIINDYLEIQVKFCEIGDKIIEYLNLNKLIDYLLNFYIQETKYNMFKGFNLINSLLEGFPINVEKLKKFDWKCGLTGFQKILFQLVEYMIEVLDKDYEFIREEIDSYRIIKNRTYIFE